MPDTKALSLAVLLSATVLATAACGKREDTPPAPAPVPAATPEPAPVTPPPAPAPDASAPIDPASAVPSLPASAASGG